MTADTSNPEPWDAMTARLKREQDARAPKPKDAAALEAERDALRKRVRDLEAEIAEWTQAGHAGWWAKKCGQAEAERDALKAENERLREALREVLDIAKAAPTQWTRDRRMYSAVRVFDEQEARWAKALGEGR